MRLTKDPHTIKIPKCELQIQKELHILQHLASIKKNHKTTKIKTNISYVHPIERVDEVGEIKTGNYYWGVV